MTDLNDLFGDIIHSYTWQNAVDDGTFICVDEHIRVQDYFKVASVAVSASVWAILDKANNHDFYGNSLSANLHDILWLTRLRAKLAKGNSDTIYTQVTIMGAGRKRNFVFKVVIGPRELPGSEPVLTILLENED